MRNTSFRRALGGAFCFLLAGFLVGCSDEVTSSKSSSVSGKSPVTSGAAVKPAVVGVAMAAKQAEPAPAKTAVKGDKKTVEVGACDGGDAVKVSAALTGQPLADNLMDQWKRNHPEAKWVAEEKERHTLKPAADNADLLKGGQGKGDTYGNFTPRDLLTWARETEKFAAEGSRIFHNADELGSTVAVSCDMCHPHAANTHPETYPKFQVQLGRVVLLRDMINWCIENPVRGAKLDPDGPKMRALEAYIMAQRKGVPMDYGRH
ncbi:MAG: c-type cytochrome [Thermoguttaceae bacterium]